MKMVIVLIIGLMTLVACEGNVFSLKVGDCYNMPDVSETDFGLEVSDVELVNCDQPHEFEVFAVIQLPDSSWNGYDYVSQQAEIGCVNKFEAFVGIKYDYSTLWVYPLFPTEFTWNETDDREVTCTIIEESNTGEIIKVTGSAKGSRR